MAENTEAAEQSTEYERVTYRPKGKLTRTIYLHRPAISGDLLNGIEVNRMGDEVTGHGVDERRLVIETAQVVKREAMVMDPLHGALVRPEGANVFPPGKQDA